VRLSGVAAGSQSFSDTSGTLSRRGTTLRQTHKPPASIPKTLSIECNQKRFYILFAREKNSKAIYKNRQTKAHFRLPALYMARRRMYKVPHAPFKKVFAELFPKKSDPGAAAPCPIHINQ